MAASFPGLFVLCCPTVVLHQWNGCGYVGRPRTWLFSCEEKKPLMLVPHPLCADIPWPEVPDEMSPEAYDIISKLLNPKYVSSAPPFGKLPGSRCLCSCWPLSFTP